MATYNWKDSFQTLPKLPRGKLWVENGEPGAATQEQIITNKLIHNEPISREERRILIECILFYRVLYNELEKFDFSGLNESEVEDFLLYIGYAFNYLPIHINDIELFTTYRLVSNSDGKSKYHRKQLSYPPLEIVQNRKLFNRANTPKTTVFYSSDSIDVAFKELKPLKSSIVTLGIWSPKTNRKFLSYPIMANPSAQFQNETAKRATLAYNGYKKKIHPLFGHFIDGYFKILNQQYSKRVKDHKEYIISAYFSDRIFEIEDKDWKIDCIIYPSVGNEFKNSNLAFKASTVDQNLDLKSVLEIEILETFYEKSSISYDPSSISVAKIRILKRSNKILDNGDIIWT